MAWEPASWALLDSTKVVPLPSCNLKCGSRLEKKRNASWTLEPSKMFKGHLAAGAEMVQSITTWTESPQDDSTSQVGQGCGCTRVEPCQGTE